MQLVRRGGVGENVLGARDARDTQHRHSHRRGHSAESGLATFLGRMGLREGHRVERCHPSRHWPSVTNVRFRPIADIC